jgi:hypothetical protein
VRTVTGFSGRIRILVTATNGSTSLSRTGIVTVRPAAPAPAGYHVVDGASTVIGWAGPQTLTPLTFRVVVNGRLACTTRTLACKVPAPLGPRATIRVTAVGGESVPSAAVAAAYSASGCGRVTAVYFDSGSAVLTPTAKRQLDALARTLNAQAFTQGCLIGYTDSVSDAWYNLRLSQRRVEAVTAYLRSRTPGLHYARSFDGENAPVASNQTSRGRAANRRVEIGAL